MGHGLEYRWGAGVRLGRSSQRLFVLGEVYGGESGGH